MKTTNTVFKSDRQMTTTNAATLSDQRTLVIKIREMQTMLASDRFSFEQKKMMWTSLRVAVKQLKQLRDNA